MANVYVLASPAPTLYVYPSVQHPVTVSGPPIGPAYQPHRRTTPARGSGRLQFRVIAAASARLRDAQARAHRTTVSIHPRPIRTAVRLGPPSAFISPHPRVVRAPDRGRAQVATAMRVRCADHRHLSLPLPVFDLLLESWDS